MSHTKAGGSTKNGRDSAAKRLGVKLFGGQQINAGGIIVRQRGTKMAPGVGVAVGKDHTIYATRDGRVSFKQAKVPHFTGARTKRTIVSVTD